MEHDAMPQERMRSHHREAVTLIELIQGLGSYGGQQALVAFHKQSVEVLTYRRLLQEADQLTAVLIESGLQKGERVLLYAPNSPAWIIAFLALLRGAAVPVPIDSQMPSDDLAHVIRDSEARRLLTTHTLAKRVMALGHTQHLATLFLDGDEGDPQNRQRSPRSGPPAIPTAQPDDHALLFYTSGSSGRPKGVPLSHRNLLANLNALVNERVYRADERLLLPLPLHHVYPFMVGLLAPLAQGLTIVLPHSLTGPHLRRALREGRVTALVAVPRLLSALFQAIEQPFRERGSIAAALFHLMLRGSVTLLRWTGIRIGSHIFSPLHRRFAPHLSTLVSGGSPLDPALSWNLAGLGWQIASGYGLTETSPILTFFGPGRRQFDSAGRPLPGVDLRIADHDPETNQGEIQARGPNVFAGYLHLPDKTREAFTADGWFRTGDLGFLDQQGRLHIVGRASSRITLPGGEKVWPESIEERMDQGSAVAESAILLYGGRLVAIVVPRKKALSMDQADEMRKAIRADLDTALRDFPSYARLTECVVSVDPLPRTRLGKIQRHKLAARFEEASRADETDGLRRAPIAVDQMTPDDRQLLEDPIVARTWDLLTRRFPDRRLTPDSNLQLDLGLDSMDWMALTLDLHDRIGIDLSLDRIARIGIVRDLLREAAEATEAADAGVDPVEQLQHPDQLLSPWQRSWLAPRGWCFRTLGQLLHRIDRLLMRVLFQLEVQGLEHLPPQGPCVLAPNHVSLLDPPTLFAALPPERLQRTSWGGWTGFMFRNLPMRLVSRATRILPIAQSTAALTDLALAGAALRRGDTLVWYAEGGLSRNGRLQPFQPGIGLLLTAYPVPVLPVFVEGSFKALPPDSRRVHPRRLTIRFGASLSPDLLDGPPQGPERYRHIAAALHDRVAALSDGTPVLPVVSLRENGYSATQIDGTGGNKEGNP
ncbi:MAG: AMP-binding protein [Nitrospira sp.]|nr:AMP-binding protein [Nitrospira sp.]QOJ36553.1 MAG: AMP-binding protein [Nitrospira sp.]